jgi:hypothetical protein
MTAVVSIINKQAAVIAADSAATVGTSKGRKILNTANKIFTLSKYHPIGIAIYNSAAFMGTPWEVIIKQYRHQLGKNSFPTVELYRDDFLEYLKNSKKLYAPTELQKQYLDVVLRELIENLIQKIPKSKPATVENYIENLEKVIGLEILKAPSQQHCPEFQDYSDKQFALISEQLFRSMYEELIKKPLDSRDISEVAKQQLFILFFKRITTLHETRFYTGLAFVGFGEEEIFPSIKALKIATIVNDRLRYQFDEDNSVNISNVEPVHHAGVVSLAQTDVIDTIITGIAPELDKLYKQLTTKTLQGLKEEARQHFQGHTPEMYLKWDAALNDVVKRYEQVLDNLQYERFIDPLLDAVATLSKEDLAEMAESLIYLTYVKRRITLAEESVGGPVDVAVISKGDGFIWIKRKHYFKPELNQNFFTRYFQEP